MAKKYHPDVDPSQEAKEKMQTVNDAYATLSDPKKRAEYDSSKHIFNKSNNEDFPNGFDDIFNSFGFDNNFDFNNWGSSASNTYQGFKSYQEKEPDFSEIIELEKQIKECKEVMENLINEIKQIAADIQNEQKNINAEIEKLRENKKSEEGYEKALQYIEKFKKRDSNRLISLTIRQKKYDLYKNCVELLDELEKQLKDLKNEKIKERIEPLEKQKEEKNKEYWDVHRKKSSLKKHIMIIL